jgi:hypothetical protein
MKVNDHTPEGGFSFTLRAILAIAEAAEEWTAKIYLEFDPHRPHL